MLRGLTLLYDKIAAQKTNLASVLGLPVISGLQEPYSWRLLLIALFAFSPGGDTGYGGQGDNGLWGRQARTFSDSSSASLPPSFK